MDSLIMAAGSVLDVSASGVDVRFTGSAATGQSFAALNAGTLSWADAVFTSLFYDYRVYSQDDGGGRRDLMVSIDAVRTPADIADTHNQRAVAGAIGDWSPYYRTLTDSGSRAEVLFAAST